MATRRLARTIVEGGRTSTYKDDVRTAKRRERRATAAYCDAARSDVTLTEGVPDPREAVGTFRCERFADSLRVLHRWLRANVGRSYDVVYAEFRRGLDVRNLKDGTSSITCTACSIPIGFASSESIRVWLDLGF